MLLIILYCASLSIAGFADVCQLYFDDSKILCIDGTRRCSGPNNISCEEAYQRVAVRFGSVPLPALPDGRLYVPTIIESTNRAIHDGLLEITNPTIQGELERLESDLRLVNVELALWAPRVLYIPDRVERYLRSLADGIQELAALDEYHDSISHTLYLSEVVTEFMYRVNVLAEVAIRMSDLRRNGFLNALIPFYHLMAEINFEFDVANSGEELVAEVAFVQTITQYHPMYTDREWRIRLHNPSSIPWRDYAPERFLLFVPAERGTECSEMEPANLSGCLEHSLRLLREFSETFIKYSGDRTGEVLSDILHLMDRLYGRPGYEMIVSYLQDRTGQMCQNTLREVFLRIRFSQFAQTRSQGLLQRFLPNCTPESTRSDRALAIVPSRRSLPSGGQLHVNVDNGEALVWFLMGQSVIEFVPKVLRLSFEFPYWRARFATLVVQPSIQKDPDTGLASIRPEISKHTRRAIGRYIGYSLWTEGSSVSGLVAHDSLNSIFLESEEVRLGAYDWLSYGAFEIY
jgi:hypothetical protein